MLYVGRFARVSWISRHPAVRPATANPDPTRSTNLASDHTTEPPMPALVRRFRIASALVAMAPLFVAASFAESDALLSDPGRDRAACARAKCLDEEINTGRALAPNDGP